MTHDLGAALWLVLLAHLIGDYLLQSDAMARDKLHNAGAAVVHGGIHGGMFLVLAVPVDLPLAPAVLAAVGVGVSHAVIDRYRLARYVVYAKEFLGPRSTWPTYKLRDTRTGYDPAKPDWLAFWLLIVADNTMHLAVNGALLWAVWPR